MNFPLIANVVVFAVLLFALGQTRHKQWSLARKVLVGLATGVVFGLALQLIYGSDSQVLKDSIQWFNIVGNGYVQLLQMIVMPLVFASILSAVARLHNASQLGKISFLSIGTLLFTTLIAALVGVLVTNMFGLTAEGLVQGSAETARLNAIQSNYVGKVADLSVPQLILSFVPKNPFADLTGANPTSIISIVIFSAFLGVAALKLLKEDVEKRPARADRDRYPAGLGNEAGSSGHAADPLRCAGPDDQSGCRVEFAGHHQAWRLRGSLVHCAGYYVCRPRPAAGD